MNPQFQRSLLPAIFAGCLMFASLASAQTDLITYQGRLEQDGVPVTGSINMRISIKDAVTAGNELFFTFGPQTVTNGEFTAILGPFGAGVFNGGNRWIEIAVDDPAVAGLNYVPLTPRQPFTAAPYALRATIATSVSGSVPAAQITGNLPTSQLSGNISPTILSSGTTTGTITFSPAAGAPFQVSSTTKVLNLNSDLLDGLDSAAFLQKSGGTMTGNLVIASPAVLDFGTTTRQNINLWGGGDFGIGVQSATMYQRTNTNFAWYQGGVHDDGVLVPGGTGVSLMTLSDSLVMLRPGRPNTVNGQGPIRIGFGDTTGGDPYVWIGESDTDDQMDLRANKINAFTRGGAATTLSFGATTGQHLVLFENGIDTYGMGVQSGTEYFRSGDNFAWYRDGAHSDTAFSPGSGGSTLMTLGATGELEIRGADNGLALHNRDDQAKRWVMYARNSGGVDQLAFYSNTGGDVASISPTGDLYLVGSLSTTVLTIRGGADVAEPFEMTEPEELEPGSVVIIDEDHPGKLKQSTQACDTRVAGIISGAGGVKPGLRLHQDGVLEGDHHVALSGRVYVKADTSGGRIKPGDLLTTSITPGHAAKVTNHERAQGAILGKAMSGLDEGTGLVLVLVTLQ